MPPQTYIFQTPDNGNLSGFPDTSELAIVAIDTIPYIARMLEMRAQAKWDTDSIIPAQQALRTTIVSMLLNLKKDLTEPSERIYRLLDNALNGTQYFEIVSPGESPVVVPEIPKIPPSTIPSALPPNALRNRLERLTALVDNLTTGATPVTAPDLGDHQALRDTLRAMQGDINGSWFGIGGRKATFADIINALRVADSNAVAEIQQTFDALDSISDAAQVVDAVSEVVGTSAETLAEGGVLATLLVSSVSNAAMLGLVANKLDRLIRSLDGGGLVAPQGDVLSSVKHIDTMVS